MRQNTPLMILSILFGLMGDIFWIGAVFFPDEIIEFFVLFSSSAEFSDLSSEGKSVIRVLIGLIASLLWLSAILLIYLSMNYEQKSRNWIAGAFTAWFVGDSIISYLGDFELNVIFNTLVIIPVAIVLYLSKDEKVSDLPN